MAETLRIALAQLNLRVGDIEGNTERILATVAEARDELAADLVAFPELALCGYPPEDLVFHAGFKHDVADAFERLRREVAGVAALFGYPEYVGERLHNAAAVVSDGEVLARYFKQCLPNYRVFDEKRYFTPGTGPSLFRLKDVPIALTICEDIWEPDPPRQVSEAGAQLVLSINGSPYEIGQQEEREAAIRSNVSCHGLPLAYVNLVGGQDELIFDGGSLVMGADGEVTMRAPAFEEGLYLSEFTLDGALVPAEASVTPIEGEEESVYHALLLGVKDYVDKHGFPGVVLGLSGGIDSSLTLAIAVDALGKDRVMAVMMPSRYTSEMSVEDAVEEARVLGVDCHSISIEPLFETALDSLSELFAGLARDTTEENIQARCRGLILMAISNKTGRMLLSTGNKSEMAVGYATLYGDMAGGFAPIKDCSKTLVYRLARYRNSLSPVIPERVLTRPPSAELRFDQKDSDSLPPYEILDPVLELFIEDDLSVDEIAARGFDRAAVGRILEMVKRNEYKRRQAPPGIRISGRAFGRDWRYPITSGYRSW